MSAYLSNILTQTTSRYNSLRRTLLPNEDDGDTEDDTHISRVLRAYYVEKGRPFPPWLPPDPNDRKSITPQPGYNRSEGSSYFGRQYSNVTNQPPASQRTSLSDLWDAPSQPTAATPQSLRNARRPVPPTQSQSSAGGLAPPQARPLPSQRTGSYQSVSSQRSGHSQYDGGQAPAGGGSAQERLKARLRGPGGRTASPANSFTGGGQNSYGQQGRKANPYD